MPDLVRHTVHMQKIPAAFCHVLRASAIHSGSSDILNLLIWCLEDRARWQTCARSSGQVYYFAAGKSAFGSLIYQDG